MLFISVMVIKKGIKNNEDIIIGGEVEGRMCLQVVVEMNLIFIYYIRKLIGNF